MLATILPASLCKWQTSPEYQQSSLSISAEKFLEVTDLLLENPNLNSTNLFRADIISDSAHILKTNAEKERQHDHRHQVTENDDADGQQVELPLNAPNLDHADIQRTVVRRLVPRKQQLDNSLVQTCHVYKTRRGGYVVVYIPHVDEEEEMPWYHPPIKALAYVFGYESTGFESTKFSSALSVRYIPFEVTDCPIATRLHRTLLSLLKTFIRLANNPAPAVLEQGTDPRLHGLCRSTRPSALKDTIIPQHLVQDTYARLKQKYASDLIARWVEKTEPSKHVFEDIMIAAFLRELWKQMYHAEAFPGFVDIACGNGVLVYILIHEGYQGFGFDARRRKTWEVLGVDEYLAEHILVPKPFLNALELTTDNVLPGILVHKGIFPPNTFIISNHADELTPWTPILATLSSPSHPLPFLAIPCCSHALSGAKHRYTPKNALPASSVNNSEEQSPSGDLKALRAQKAKAAVHGDEKSMYACLTKKVVGIAEELGLGVEMTLMRIPSTRNIGIVGNRKKVIQQEAQGSVDKQAGLQMDEEGMDEKIRSLIKRECSISGGLQTSARTWIERAQKLQTGKGRGKVNLGHKPEAVPTDEKS